MNYLHAANIVGREYRLTYDMVGGCMETQQFRDSIGALNHKVLEQLAQEFGAGWQTHFDAKVDSMEFLISQAESVVRLDTDYEKKEKELEAKKTILSLWTEPSTTKDVFSVEAYKVTLGVKDGVPYDESTSKQGKRNVYYRWAVDINKHKIVDKDL